MSDPVEKLRSRFAGLIEISESLMKTFEIEELIRIILNRAVALFSAEACSIALVESDDQLSFSFSAGKAAVGAFRIKLGEGIASWVIQSGQGVICNDTSSDNRFYKGVDEKTGHRTRNLLCAPIRQPGMIIGAIEVLNTHDAEGFNQEDLELLSALGAMVGTAISRAKTFTATFNSNIALNEAVQSQYCFVGNRSEKIRAVLTTARMAAPTASNVLILGESGTGKEIIARKIHEWSRRAKGPFIAINCGAITRDLIGSELFGHEKGSFTSANVQRRGKFELANGGSLFLDEIGDLPPDSQAMLLRVLQEKEFQRVGGTGYIRTDVRIIAATNRDLRLEIKEKKFREDLYYRLNVVTLIIPPLRERLEDIELLIQHFIGQFCREVKRPPLQIEPAVVDLLKNYHWPGNIRELQNLIERAVVLSPLSASSLTQESFPLEIWESSTLAVDGTASLPSASQLPQWDVGISQYKRELIKRALQKTGGNQTEAARLLGLQRTYLSRLLKSWNLGE